MIHKTNYYLNMNIDEPSRHLRSFFLLGLYMLIFLSPFWRGLYFEKDLLPAVVLAAIAFIICLAEQFITRDADFFHDPLDIAMLAIWSAYFLSLLTAVHRHDAVVELLKVSAFVMVYWMAVRAGRIERDFRRLLLAAYMAAVGMAIIGLGAALGWVHFEGAYGDGHIRSTLQYHNALAIYLAAMNVVGLALSLRTAKLLPRLGFMAGNYLLVVVILGSLSRGTWLLYPLAMVLLILFIPSSYRRRAVYQLLILVGTGLLAGRFFFNNLNNSNELIALVFLILGLLMSISISMIRVAPLKIMDQLAAKGIKPRAFLALGSIGLVLLAMFFISTPSSLTGVMRYIVPDTAIARAQKTSVQDNSLQERLDANTDVLKIIKDYPIMGTGGGGWKALYHSYASRLYWVNEVHNVYLKIWVDAGILGFISLLALAFFLLRKLNRMRALNREDSDKLLLWAIAVAVLLIAVHSSFDFELSMAAVGFLFFGFIGLIRGRTVEFKLEKKEQLLYKDGNKGGKYNAKCNSLFIAFLTAGLLAFFTGITAGCFHIASLQGERGAQALETRRLDEAQKLYLKASSLDPYLGTYQVNLAKIAAVKAGKDKDERYISEALEHARKASMLEPYNPKLHNALIAIYGTLGRTDLQLTETNEVIRINPFLPESYELLSNTAMKAAWICLDRGQIKEAFSYFRLLVLTREKMPVNTADSTPAFNMAVGQSALLLGETELARKYINQAVLGEDSINKTARLWMAGVDYITSQQKINGTITNNHEVYLNTLLAFLKQVKG
jgi:O-antigen ligase